MEVMDFSLLGGSVVRKNRNTGLSNDRILCLNHSVDRDGELIIIPTTTRRPEVAAENYI
jgi:hypothetical protein